MHCPSSPFRNPGLHLQVKPTGEETLGAKRHNWSHFVFSQGLFAWGCSAIWLASTDRGCETRWDTTVSFLPLYFLKREKTQNIFLFLHVQLITCKKYVHTFIFEKLIKKKAETLHYCFAIYCYLCILTLNLQPPNFNLGRETRCDKTISVLPLYFLKRGKIIWY